MSRSSCLVAYYVLAKKEDFHTSCDGGFPGGTEGPVVSASVLAADFSDLKGSINAVEAAGADWLHVDVMDGCFVPSLTMGPVVISGIRKCTDMFLDVHLMIKSPGCHIQSVVDAGADMITVHVESEVHLCRLVGQIRLYGKKVGVSVVPKTHHSALEYIIHDLDVVLVMTVDPGFGGQEFLDAQLKKIENIRAMIDKNSLQTKIAVDGGISTKNAQAVLRAGADILVVGTSLFGSPDMKKTVRALKSF